MKFRRGKGYKIPSFTTCQKHRKDITHNSRHFRENKIRTLQPYSITLFRFVLLSSDADLRDLLPRDDDLFFTREFLSKDFDLLLSLWSLDLDRRLSLSLVSCCLLDLLLSPDFDRRCRRRSSDFDLLLLLPASASSADPCVLRAGAAGSVYNPQELLASRIAQADIKKAGKNWKKYIT